MYGIVDCPGCRAHCQIVQDSDSDSYSTSDDSIDVCKIKQEANNALGVWDDMDSDGNLEYFDEENDNVDREIMRVTAPQIGHNLLVHASPTSPAPSPIGNSPDAVAVNSPATSTPELSALRPRTKRKAAKVECICGKEVTNDQCELDAVKCIWAGCETIWTAQLQRSGVRTGFAARVRRLKRGVRHRETYLGKNERGVE
ncbi:hypothetical protein DFH08DRAFT_812049 [Mycena albidolilacea]|uniref:Uncharacterized protein n=1 Tax=Mycena albidolilacea TaxID=1033008 RepID=A0AAD6ZVA0_9AGAR|nr:hypothetical protein DFH08DRAFT_812049 [Mycena albidolilacea]